MKIPRRLFPSALALSFLVGCAGEDATNVDETPTPAPPVSNPSSPTPAEVKSPAEAGAPDATAPEKADAKPDAKPEDKAPELTPAPEKADDKAPAEEPKKSDAKPSLEGPAADAGAAKLSAEELANIKELPADEQAAALAQAVCPVSHHKLGSMDAPIKTTAEGRTFYLCCEACQKKVKNDPKAVIAELDELVKK